MPSPFEIVIPVQIVDSFPPLSPKLTHKKLVIICSYKPDPLLWCLSCPHQNSRRIPLWQYCKKSLKGHEGDVILVRMEHSQYFLLDVPFADPSSIVQVVPSWEAIKDLEEALVRCIDKFCEFHPGTPKILVRLKDIWQDQVKIFVKSYRL